MSLSLLMMKSSLTCLILSLVSISTCSSSSSPSKHFQILNLSSSRPRQQANQIVSPNSSPHTLSLTLVSRSSFHSATATTNYSSLTLSRLARDQSHVRSLLSRLSLQSPAISSLSQGSGEYLARIGVGHPPAHLYMIIDTGSDISWLQCKPCLHCYRQSDPIFDPAASSTYAPIPCLSPQCTALDSPTCSLFGTCLYQVLYGDASHTIGDLATETISFNSSVARVAIGCGHENGGLFSGAAGLLGLGGGKLSLPAQLRATSFSYCLVNRDSNSSSTLDFNSTAPDDSVAAPLLDNPSTKSYHYVGMTGISVGGEAVSFVASLLEMGSDGSGGVIVDSGTTVTRLRRDVYTAVRDAFRNKTRELPPAGAFSLLDTCYDLSSLSGARIPTVAFEFGAGKTVALPPQNILIAVDGGGKFCLALAGMAGKLSIIGNVQQQGMRVTYDLANKFIAFSPNKC